MPTIIDNMTDEKHCKQMEEAIQDGYILPSHDGYYIYKPDYDTETPAYMKESPEPLKIVYCPFCGEKLPNVPPYTIA